MLKMIRISLRYLLPRANNDARTLSDSQLEDVINKTKKIMDARKKIQPKHPYVNLRIKLNQGYSAYNVHFSGEKKHLICAIDDFIKEYGIPSNVDCLGVFSGGYDLVESILKSYNKKLKGGPLNAIAWNGKVVI